MAAREYALGFVYLNDTATAQYALDGVYVSATSTVDAVAVLAGEETVVAITAPSVDHAQAFVAPETTAAATAPNVLHGQAVAGQEAVAAVGSVVAQGGDAPPFAPTLSDSFTLATR